MLSKKITQFFYNFFSSFYPFLLNFFVIRPQLGEVLDEKKISYITRNLLLTLAANGKIHEANKVRKKITKIQHTDIEM